MYKGFFSQIACLGIVALHALARINLEVHHSAALSNKSFKDRSSGVVLNILPSLVAHVVKILIGNDCVGSANGIRI